MGTGMGVGRESRIVEQNPICEMERKTEKNPKQATEQETTQNLKWKKERKMEWEGDKAPYLTNVWYLKNIGCCVLIYSQGVCWPLYT